MTELSATEQFIIETLRECQYQPKEREYHIVLNCPADIAFTPCTCWVTGSNEIAPIAIYELDGNKKRRLGCDYPICAKCGIQYT